MKHFAELFQRLDQTNKTNERVEALKSYFISAPEADRIWALALFTGRRPPRPVKSSQLHQWALEQSGIPAWLFDECYSSVGDQAETISLVLRDTGAGTERSLDDWFRAMAEIAKQSDEQKKEFITRAWSQLTRYEIFVFNKLLMGSFRIGVSQTLVVRAVAEAVSMEASTIAHRVMGEWDPFQITFHDLIQKTGDGDQASKPYPFYLAYAIEGQLEDLGEPAGWFAEWKWDGIRSQVIKRNNKLFVWSRGEDLVTEKFPELQPFIDFLPDGTVLDGEIICFQNGRPLPFGVLQTRIGRKNLSKKILADAPVSIITYDLLEFGGRDVREEPQEVRRDLLEKLYNRPARPAALELSALIDFKSWEDLRSLHNASREHAAEGFMLKRKSATYQVGRRKGDWWKWKIDPLVIDAVLVYAAKGHGRRSELYTDYTFAVWENDKLIPFAKAYSGLTNEEIREVDRFIRQNTLEKFGPVRTVKPELVFEIGFEGITRSNRHKSGIAVRFPRMLRWRNDKPAVEANTLDDLRKMLEQFG
jgi:DNA ligase-1